MAVIKYETADGPIEYDVPSSAIDYEPETDHWRIKTGEQNGRDVFEIIPRERVFSVSIAGNSTDIPVIPTE